MKVLEKCHGMRWDKFVRFVKSNLVVFATSHDETLRGAARLANEQGVEAAAQLLAAVQLVDNNPHMRVLRTAVQLYKNAAKKQQLDKLTKQLDDMESDFYWLSGYSGSADTVKWPIRYPLRRLNKHVGILHLIMHLILKDCGNSTGVIAYSAFTRFLNESRSKRTA